MSGCQIDFSNSPHDSVPTPASTNRCGGAFQPFMHVGAHERVDHAKAAPKIKLAAIPRGARSRPFRPEVFVTRPARNDCVMREFPRKKAPYDSFVPTKRLRAGLLGHDRRMENVPHSISCRKADAAFKYAEFHQSIVRRRIRSCRRDFEQSKVKAHNPVVCARPRHCARRTLPLPVEQLRQRRLELPRVKTLR